MALIPYQILSIDPPDGEANCLVTTSTPHGLTTNDYVAIVGAVFDAVIGGPFLPVQVTVMSSTTFKVSAIDICGAGGGISWVSGGIAIRNDGLAPNRITGATNASPIVITSATHELSSGDVIRVSSVGGNTAANGDWQITKVDSNSFSLDGSTGNSNYTSGGTWTADSCALPLSYVDTDASDGIRKVGTPTTLASVAAHGLTTGDVISISGMKEISIAGEIYDSPLNNSPQNPQWTVTVISSRGFKLDGSQGTHTPALSTLTYDDSIYYFGGFWKKVPVEDENDPVDDYDVSTTTVQPGDSNIVLLIDDLCQEIPDKAEISYQISKTGTVIESGIGYFLASSNSLYRFKVADSEGTSNRFLDLPSGTHGVELFFASVSDPPGAPDNVPLGGSRSQNYHNPPLSEMSSQGLSNLSEAEIESFLRALNRTRQQLIIQREQAAAAKLAELEKFWNMLYNGPGGLRARQRLDRSIDTYNHINRLGRWANSPPRPRGPLFGTGNDPTADELLVIYRQYQRRINAERLARAAQTAREAAAREAQRQANWNGAKRFGVMAAAGLAVEAIAYLIQDSAGVESIAQGMLSPCPNNIRNDADRLGVSNVLFYVPMPGFNETNAKLTMSHFGNRWNFNICQSDTPLFVRFARGLNDRPPLPNFGSVDVMYPMQCKLDDQIFVEQDGSETTRIPFAYKSSVLGDQSKVIKNWPFDVFAYVPQQDSLSPAWRSQQPRMFFLNWAAVDNRQTASTGFRLNFSGSMGAITLQCNVNGTLENWVTDGTSDAAKNKFYRNDEYVYLGTGVGFSDGYCCLMPNLRTIVNQFNRMEYEDFQADITSKWVLSRWMGAGDSVGGRQRERMNVAAPTNAFWRHSWVDPCDLRAGAVPFMVPSTIDTPVFSYEAYAVGLVALELWRKTFGKTITDISTATPIVVTCVGHGLVTSDIVVIDGIQTSGILSGVRAHPATGRWSVTRLSANTFSLDNSVGSTRITYAGFGYFEKVTDINFNDKIGERQVPWSDRNPTNVRLNGRVNLRVAVLSSSNIQLGVDVGFRPGLNYVEVRQAYSRESTQAITIDNQGRPKPWGFIGANRPIILRNDADNGIAQFPVNAAQKTLAGDLGNAPGNCGLRTRGEC